MTFAASRWLVPVFFVVGASNAVAQFDNAWITFAPDTNRLRAADGSPATNVATLSRERDVAWGDLDRDGWVDMVVVTRLHATGATPNVLLMNEYGTFVDRTAAYGVDSDVPGDLGLLESVPNRDVILADVDLDGWLDVITSTSFSAAGTARHRSHPRVYRNQGVDANGHWRGVRYESSRIPMLYTPTQSVELNGVAAGDVTGDGYPDLYFTGRYFDRLLVNDGTGVFVDSGTTRLAANMLSVPLGSTARIVDMNGDGARDIVRCAGGTDAPSQPICIVSIAYNDPANVGHFPAGLYQIDVGGGGAWYVDVADMNNDGRLDIALPTDLQDTYRYNVGLDVQGRATWGPVHTYSFLTGADDGFGGNNLIADLDGDGWKDVIQTNVDLDIPGCYGARCHLYHNPGGTIGSEILLREEAGLATGAWRGAVGMLASDWTDTFDVAAFDIDNDGDTDLVLSRCAGTFVWMNQQTSPPVPTTYCSGDGSGTGCPCGNVGAAGNGCANSQNASGGRLDALGVARVSNDSWHLSASGVTNSPGLYFQGVGQAGGGLGVAFGDGLRCVGHTVVRLGVVAGVANASTYPSAAPASTPISVKGGVLAGDTRNYQLWYRDSSVAYCTASVFNLTNGVQVTWAP